MNLNLFPKPTEYDTVKTAYNPYTAWERQHINDASLWQMKVAFDKDKPKLGGFDTETTGLHIKKDKPFLMIFGWYTKGQKRVYTFEPTSKAMRLFFDLARALTFCVAQNVKYDLHMLSNIGYQEEVEAMENLTDTMIVARLSLESLPARLGGDSLGLKYLGKKYVHYKANEGEKQVADALQSLNKQRMAVLAQALKQFPLEGEFTETGRQKYWGKGAIEKFLKNIENEVEDLPHDVAEVWQTWEKEYPEPGYQDVPFEVMVKYAGDDVITMLEMFVKFFKTMKARDNMRVFKIENRVILPLFRMERVGVKADMEYLEKSRVNVKAEIKRLRAELEQLAGVPISVGQHAEIKKVYDNVWNIKLANSDKAALKRVMKEHEGDPKRFAEIINQLRTLEKWYSTYIVRVLENAKFDGYVYTQLNQCSAVSGRMSSDFQQFPKNALKDENGQELYHPRKAFVTRGGAYTHLAYIDLDQIELVNQANYTLYVSGGDLNLCRAYMPFKCVHSKTGELYDYKNKEHKKKALDVDSDGHSVWLVPETKEPWVKTDVHAETTHKAFPHIPLGTPEFKDWRSKGKTFNFLANYGGGKGAAMKQLDLAEEEADALVRGYDESFPGVRLYQEAILRQFSKNGFVKNMFGMSYYLSLTNKGYVLANYCIQGTCAIALKAAIIMIDLCIQMNGLKTQLMMPVHDELQFNTMESELSWLENFREIMSLPFEPFCYVPVTAGIELSQTTWADKKEVA